MVFVSFALHIVERLPAQTARTADKQKFPSSISVAAAAVVMVVALLHTENTITFYFKIF